MLFEKQNPKAAWSLNWLGFTGPQIITALSLTCDYHINSSSNKKRHSLEVYTFMNIKINRHKFDLNILLKGLKILKMNLIYYINNYYLQN